MGEEYILRCSVFGGFDGTWVEHATERIGCTQIPVMALDFQVFSSMVRDLIIKLLEEQLGSLNNKCSTLSLN